MPDTITRAAPDQVLGARGEIAMPRKTVAGVHLDSVPEVDALLSSAGIGTMLRETVTSPIGRNTSWRGRTALGHDVFVKLLRGSDSARRFDRTLAFEEHRARAGGRHLRAPTLLASDHETGLLVFELIADGESGGDRMVQETFDERDATDVGHLLGELHSTGAVSAALDESPPPLPPLDYFDGLPLSSYLESSAAELEAWHLLQADHALADGLRRLRQAESGATRVPSHCDFRVDQLVFAEGGPYLVDWEEFRLADPARDVGAFIGEWLFRAMLDLVTDRGDSGFVDVEFTHEVVLERGAAKLDRLLPLVRAFLHGYAARRGPLDSGSAVRATAFAGWHLLDRLIAGATSAHRLAGVQRASAGVGRNAVLNPERFAVLFGFDEVTA